MSRNPFVRMNDQHPIKPVAVMPTQPAMPDRTIVVPVGMCDVPVVRADPFGNPSAWVRFRVFGLPAPKGSKSYKGRRKNGSAIMIESAAETLGPWSERVERAARMSGVTFAGPVEVDTTFVMPRPKRPSFTVPAVKPDGDKLTRAVWDALEAGGMIESDARVVRWSGSKRYAMGNEAPGVYVAVREFR